MTDGEKLLKSTLDFIKETGGISESDTYLTDERKRKENKCDDCISIFKDLCLVTKMKPIIKCEFYNIDYYGTDNRYNVKRDIYNTIIKEARNRAEVRHEKALKHLNIKG